MTAEELIAAGPNVKPGDSQVEAQLKGSSDLTTIPAQTGSEVRIESVGPAKVKTDQIKSDGTSEDPLERFKSIVTEKVKPDDKSKDATKGDKETNKEDKSGDKTSSEGDFSRTKEDETPPTARLPKKPLEDQLKEEDLTGLDPSAIDMFKQMSKPAREYVKARLKENTELKAKLSQSPNSLPQNWFDHEEAYILHPEFKKNIALATRVSNETKYWQKQLQLVRKGEKWKDLEQGKDGNLYEVEMEPDVNAEDELQARIREGERQYREYNSGALAVKQMFENQRSQSMLAIKAIEEKFFPQYVNDKEHANHKYTKNIQEVLGRFNQSNNILSGFLTNLYRFALETLDEKAELEKKIDSKKSLEEERIKAGPTSGEIQGGRGKPVSGEDRPFDMAEFNKYKGG